jgi:hypothetical protein
MNLPHDKFCVLPWISLEASPVGTVRPCCLADDEILDDAGNKFELSTFVLLIYIIIRVMAKVARMADGLKT